MARLGSRLLTAGLASVLAACGLAATAPDEPVTVVSGSYLYACGGWSPSAPPATRVLFDVGVNGTLAPDEAAISAIEAAGGKTIHRFNLGLVRVELNVSAVPALSRSQPTSLTYARTASDASKFPVNVGVWFTHVVIDQDLQAFTALGGVITSTHAGSTLFAGTIDDARVPDVRALAGIRSVFDNAPTGCAAAAGR